MRFAMAQFHAGVPSRRLQIIQPKQDSHRAMLYDLLGPLGISLLVLLILYRCVRRSFGQQQVKIVGLGLRITLMGSLSVVVLSLPFVVAWAKFAGFSVGLGLALVAVRSTRLEHGQRGWHYVPNPYLGLVVLSLLVGKILYRIVSTELACRFGDNSIDTSAAIQLAASPLSAVLVLALFSYYAAYLTGILVRYHFSAKCNRSAVGP